MNFIHLFDSSWLWPLTLTFLTSYVILKFVKRRSWVNEINKIPGPKGFPILGNLTQLGFRNRALKVFDFMTIFDQSNLGMAQLYQKEKLWKIWTLNKPIVFLCHSDSLEPVLNSSVSIGKGDSYNFFHPWLGQGLLTSSGNKWRRMRKALTPTFHFQILKEFLPIMNEQALILVQKLHASSKEAWIDVVPLLSRCTLDIICETAMGVSIGSQLQTESEYVDAIHKATHSVVYRATKPWLKSNFIYSLTEHGRENKKVLKTLHDFTTKVIADRKASRLSNSSSQDNKKRLAFLDLLLEKDLSDLEVQQEVDTFMFGGHDTTAIALTWLLYNIGHHPDVEEKLYDEILSVFGDDKQRHADNTDISNLKYMDLVLKESQRLYPSVLGVSRVLAEDTNIIGYNVPKGTDCILFFIALNRDQNTFPNPDEFIPERFNSENQTGRNTFAFLPFSAGPRNCIGQKYANMEVKIILSYILRNFKLKSLDPRDKVLTKGEVVLRPAKAIRIKFIPRK